MSRFDQAKMLMKVKKIQKELEKQQISIEKGEGAVRVEINGEQKIKKIQVDKQKLKELKAQIDRASYTPPAPEKKVAAKNVTNTTVANKTIQTKGKVNQTVVKTNVTNNNKMKQPENRIKVALNNVTTISFGPNIHKFARVFS